MGVEVLEGQNGIMRVLLYLEANEKASVTDLMRKGEINQTALYNSLDRLKSLGLIAEAEERTFPRRRLLSLTAKGKKVARTIKRLHEDLAD